MVHNSYTTDLADPASSSSTSSSLLARVKALDPEAWRRLVRLYGPLIYRWCRQAGMQAADAADVAQEVFRTVLLKVREFHGDQVGDSFRGWLRAITRNKIGNHISRLKGRPRAQGGTGAQKRFLEIPEPPAPPQANEGSWELNLLARSALTLIRGEFEDRTWQAFWRLVAEGRSPADVAQELGMTLCAVYKAKSRVLCRLRQHVDGLST
jgi:RNA polymerase sigma-70 factor (ECF subfamily)